MTSIINKRKCILIGGGALAREVYEWSQQRIHEKSFPSIRGYVSDDGPTSLSEDYELAYLGEIDKFEPQLTDCYLICIADSIRRKDISCKLSKKNIEPVTFIHQSAIIASNALIKSGSIIFPFAVISAKAIVGNYVIVNSFAGIGHDSLIGDFSTISAHVDITGYAELEEGVFMGSGSRVLPEKVVGAWSKIGSGAIVFCRVKPRTVMLPQISKKFMS